MSGPSRQEGAHERWSVLPPVPLLGVETPLVESVEHYMSRLAWISGTTVHHIISLRAPFDEPGARQAGGVSKFCGPSKTFRRRIENLEALTGIDTIRCGSFLILEEVLAASSMGRDSKKKRWCPICYRRWDEQASWEPLLWNIELQVTCPIHGCLLEKSCPTCGAQQRMSVRYCKRRLCSNCGGSLGGAGKFKARSEYERWTEAQLSDLIKLCATPGQKSISARTIEAFARGLIQSPKGSRETTAAVKRIARLLLVRRSTGASRRIGLRGLIDLSAIQGITVTDILRQPSESASRPLLDHWTSYCSLSHPKNPDDRTALFDESLRIFLASCDLNFLPALSILLTDVKISRNTVQLAFDGVLKGYLKRYAGQEQGPMRVWSSKIFRRALEGFSAPDFNPFLPCDLEMYAKRTMKHVKGISLAQAMPITKSALLWRRALERGKAKVLGISAEQHYLATSLRGFASRSCS